MRVIVCGIIHVPKFIHIEEVEDVQKYGNSYEM